MSSGPKRSRKFQYKKKASNSDQNDEMGESSGTNTSELSRINVGSGVIFARNFKKPSSRPNISELPRINIGSGVIFLRRFKKPAKKQMSLLYRRRLSLDSMKAPKQPEDKLLTSLFDHMSLANNDTVAESEIRLHNSDSNKFKPESTES